jgi:hypothetical protein
MSDESRLKITGWAEHEEARLFADFERLGTDRMASMVSGLRLSILAETDPLKRAILRGAYLSAVRYIADYWGRPQIGGIDGSEDNLTNGGPRFGTTGLGSRSSLEGPRFSKVSPTRSTI